ncbi:MAG: hypothetical protein K0R18_381 [Bacillales bacterium]|jgi:DnaJ-class molecular chaperone|nr:hypothetical protein [Bacillales bacterium]
MNSLKVKKKLKEIVCDDCHGDGEREVPDEWCGTYRENCTTCNTKGTIIVYKGMQVIDTMEVRIEEED